MSFLAVGIGAGAGVLKSFAIDKPRENRQRELAAATQQFSPWTGLKADPVQPTNLFGNALQFGSSAGMLKGALNNYSADAALKQQYTQNLKNNPWATPAFSESSQFYPAGTPANQMNWNF